ncbi:DsrH/TusB family sulfur metabolism protein [Alteromonas sp. S015]|uniref:DsrH/TusB family sulfur metabolism protein n=1 Tax=Alteromonas sp. S015 TaxID=3117401 RepID=UPI002FE152B6
MLITISTPHLSDADKQLLISASEQPAANIWVIFNGDGVYAPALEAAFFQTLPNLEDNESMLNFAFVSNDAIARGVNMPKHIKAVSNSEFATISAKHKHWIPLS